MIKLVFGLFQLGFYTLSILSEVAPDQFLVHAQLFGILFISTLRSLTDLASPVAYLTLVCMTHFVPTVDGDQAVSIIYLLIYCNKYFL